jgi:glutamyl-tRNA synthetase
MSKIRTRFAPSPTGFMHVGNLRTGLFAWLTARNAQGEFILRLEDTDKNREVEGSAEHILECLNMLGLERDEGIDVGGPHAPYKQSERLEIYRAWAQKLIDAGRAYADPYSSEEVQVFRDAAKASKKAFLYREHRPENPPVWDGSQPLRLKSNPKVYEWHDQVMGDLKTGPEVIDDIILIKSDGYPTYNFAHIVDDAEMEISHVIRGQEFISSTPNYLNLYEALGVTPPVFATMPHILNEHGNKKLGKRDGAKDVLDYVREGFLPETLLSFIATLGWNDGTEQEVFTRVELIAKFRLDRVQKSGARFDEKRLLWMNGQFIRDLSVDELYKRVENFWPEEATESDEARKKQVLTLVQDRLKTLADLSAASRYFFAEPAQDISLITDNKQLKKLEKTEITALVRTTHEALENLTDWTPQAIQDTLNHLLETTGQKPGVLFSLIRIVTTWAPFSPQLNDTLALLGKETVLQRLATPLK